MVSRQSGVARPSVRHRIVALTLAFGIGIAFAAPGDLDAGFGDNGLLSLTIGIDDPTTNAYSVIQQADGKLVLAGRTNCDFVAVQLAANGTPDASFGVDGIATADFGIGETCDFAFAVIQQSDGKLVLAGGAMFEPATERSDIALARFNADGSLDATFGAAGLVTLDFDFVEHAVGLIQQANGKLVIAGTTNSSTNFPANSRPFFARLNTNGSLDTSFGSGGTTFVGFAGGSESRATGLAQQADGKLVAVGSPYGGVQGMGLMRLTADGILDPSFDSDGKLTVSFEGNYAAANAVAIQSDGSIIVAGHSGGLTDPSGSFDAALLRVTDDGILDITFGDGGKSVIGLVGGSSSLNSVLVLPDNSLVATGRRRTSELSEDMIVAHFSSIGTLDLTYGVEGVATADFGIGDKVPVSQGTAITEQTDGKLVVVGPTYFNGAISAARFDDGAAHPGVIGLTQASQSVDEAMATVAYTVRRTGGSSGTVSVDYATAAETALPDSDFDSTSGTLTWNTGDVDDKLITINLVQDSVTEGSERFLLSLTSPTGGAALAASTATTEIRSEQGPGELTFDVFGYSTTGTEGDSNIRVPVYRIFGSQGEVSVSYRIIDTGNAAPAVDFVISGTLAWADGETGRKNIVVDYLEDAAVEGDESFTIELITPTGGATIRQTLGRMVMFIRDNDEGFFIPVTNVSVNESEGSLQIVVAKVGSLDRAASVDYSTANGTAVAGSDYSEASGTLTWAAGDPQPKTIEIPITNDQGDESNESFTVSLSNPTGGFALGSNSTVTILDNDTSEGGSGGGGAFGAWLLAFLYGFIFTGNVQRRRKRLVQT